MEGPFPILVVAAALCDAAGRVLVQRRPADRHHGGLWEFPGGKLESGETPETALVRELAEELAIAVDPHALVATGFATPPPIVLLLYTCRRWEGVPVSTEGGALRWVQRAELDGLPMPPGDRALIAAPGWL